MGSIADYLPVKVAEYIATELILAPHQIMIEEGDMEQIIHTYDDGDDEIVTVSPSFFKTTLQWDYVVISEVYNFMRFWYEYANCFGNSFYWHHPVDLNTYVARFETEPVFTSVSDFISAMKIPPITLGIEGVKG